MDKGTATKYHFTVGDRVRVLPARTGRRRSPITGIVTFGTADNLAGATLAGFDLPTAQQLFNCPRLLRHDQRPGRSRAPTTSAFSARSPRSCRPGVEVVSGQTVAERAVDRGQQRALVPLDGAADLRAASRCSSAASRSSTPSRSPSGSGPASSRCSGWSERAGGRSSGRCSPRPPRRTGRLPDRLGLGVLAALGLEGAARRRSASRCRRRRWCSRPARSCRDRGRRRVTVLSAIGPARRAVRIAPVAALGRPARSRPDRPSRRRRSSPALAAVWSVVVALVLGLTAPAHRAGRGRCGWASFIAVGMLAPLVARPMSSALGRPLAALLGTPGRLGRENSMRSPRRTAQTAAALMVGLALVSTDRRPRGLAVVLGHDQHRQAVTADYIISWSQPGFSNSVAAAASRASPGCRTVTTVYTGQFEVRGSLSTLARCRPGDLQRTVTWRGRGSGPAPSPPASC